MTTAGRARPPWASCPSRARERQAPLASATCAALVRCLRSTTQRFVSGNKHLQTRLSWRRLSSCLPLVNAPAHTRGTTMGDTRPHSAAAHFALLTAALPRRCFSTCSSSPVDGGPLHSRPLTQPQLQLQLPLPPPALAVPRPGRPAGTRGAWTLASSGYYGCCATARASSYQHET